MNKTLQIIIGIIITAVIILVGVWYEVSRKPMPEERVIKIAVNMPLTGNLSIFGIPVQEGLTMAYDEAVLKEEIKSDEIKFDFEDNQGQPVAGVTVWHKQKIGKPDIYISGVGINTTAFNQLVEEAGIPHVIFGWAIGLTKQTENTIRCWLHYKLELSGYLKYLEKKNPNKVAIIYANYDPYVELVDEYLLPELKKRNIDVHIQVFNPNTKDFNTIVAKAKEYNPDLIILDAFPHELAVLVKALRTFDLIKPDNVIGTMDFIDAPLFLSEEVLENIIFPAPAFIAKGDDPVIKEWKERFIKKFNKEPSYTAAYAYDLMNIILSIYKSNPTIKEGEFIKQLRNIHARGITGVIEFDEDGDLVTEMYLLQYKEGNLVEIK